MESEDAVSIVNKKTQSRKKKVEEKKCSLPASETPKKSEEVLYIKPDDYLEPSEYSISTMTITTQINGLFPLIDLVKLFDKIEPENGGIMAIKHGYTVKTILPEKKKRKNSIEKKVFYNQLTFIVSVGNDKNVNIKIFSNGKVQMTGCKSRGDIKIGMKKLIQKIADVDEDPAIFCAGDKLNFNEPKIEMINSNFATGFHMNLKKLYYILDDIFRKNTDKIISVRYEKCIYPGINLKLANLDEITKPYKNKHGQLRYDKKISVFIFGSGNIIITGANNTEQIETAYKYVNDVIEKNFGEIVQ